MRVDCKIQLPLFGTRTATLLRSANILMKLFWSAMLVAVIVFAAARALAGNPRDMRVGVEAELEGIDLSEVGALAYPDVNLVLSRSISDSRGSGGSEQRALSCAAVSPHMEKA
jgi:hypothetical protein